MVLLAALPGPAGAQSTDPRVAWLATNATPIHSLAFDADDADLASIGRAIGSSRLVFLGEESHGDGATFQAKARLIRYLHRRLGFDLLVFESGFYDCRRTWVDARAGMALADSADGCMFPLWANSEQVQPLLQYLDQQKGGPQPLELAGMDFQLSGRKARELAGDLTRFVSTQPNAAALGPDLKPVTDLLHALFTNPRALRSTPDSVRAAFRASVARLAAGAAAPAPAMGSLGEPAFWHRTLTGFQAWTDFAWAMDPRAPDPAVFNRRDSVMAANLVWLVRRHPDRKVVIWGASSHFIRNRTGIEGDPAPNMVPAGHLVSLALGSEVYILGFLAAEGEIGFANPGTKTPHQPVPPADSTMLDGLWARTDQKVGFLDLRARRPGDEWLHRPLTARPLGYGPMTAVWPDHLDGFLWIRRMTPSTPRNGRLAGGIEGPAEEPLPFAGLRPGNQLERAKDQKHREGQGEPGAPLEPGTREQRRERRPEKGEQDLDRHHLAEQREPATPVGQGPPETPEARDRTVDGCRAESAGLEGRLGDERAGREPAGRQRGQVKADYAEHERLVVEAVDREAEEEPETGNGHQRQHHPAEQLAAARQPRGLEGQLPPGTGLVGSGGRGHQATSPTEAEPTADRPTGPVEGHPHRAGGRPGLPGDLRRGVTGRRQGQRHPLRRRKAIERLFQTAPEPGDVVLARARHRSRFVTDELHLQRSAPGQPETERDGPVLGDTGDVGALAGLAPEGGKRAPEGDGDLLPEVLPIGGVVDVLPDYGVEVSGVPGQEPLEAVSG